MATYYYVSYGGVNSETYDNYCQWYSTNPWTNTSSSKLYTYNNSGDVTNKTKGTWKYATFSYTNDSAQGMGNYMDEEPDINNSKYIKVDSSTDSLYVYLLGQGGTSTTTDGGGGGGGFGAICANMTQYNLCYFGNSYTPSSYSCCPYNKNNWSSYQSFIYAGTGYNATSSSGGNGADYLTTSQSTQPSSINCSYTGYTDSSNQYDVTNTYSDTIDHNVGFVTGGPGGMPVPETDGTEATSYPTLPSGCPNWITSTTSSGSFTIIMADGTSYEMSNASAGTNSPVSAILFAIFKPDN